MRLRAVRYSRKPVRRMRIYADAVFGHKKTRRVRRVFTYEFSGSGFHVFSLVPPEPRIGRSVHSDPEATGSDFFVSPELSGFFAGSAPPAGSDGFFAPFPFSVEPDRLLSVT